jgi:transposase
LVILASAGGNSVPVAARLVAADEDTIREVIHRFNELGLRVLDPGWAGGRPRRISAEDEAFLVATATTRPTRLSRPFTHWSLRKLVDHLADNPVRIVRIGRIVRERLRQLLAAHEISFQRTKTWKESPEPEREAKLARIETVLATQPDRVFAFDEFGPLACAPTQGGGWAQRPDCLQARHRQRGRDPVWGRAGSRRAAAPGVSPVERPVPSRPRHGGWWRERCRSR